MVVINAPKFHRNPFSIRAKLKKCRYWHGTLLGQRDIVETQQPTPSIAWWRRVAYKLAVTFYRCLHGLAPSYLAQSVRRVAELDRRRLRSSSSDDVIIPTTRLVTVGDRAFTAAGSRLWNSLPPDIRSVQTLPVFCNRLKTYLFSKCFPT